MGILYVVGEGVEVCPGYRVEEDPGQVEEEGMPDQAHRRSEGVQQPSDSDVDFERRGI